MINPKTMGPRPVHPSQVFDYAPKFPIAQAGKISLQVQNGPCCVPQFQGDCLDVEIHQTIVWDFSPAGGL
jgi:hypothetical protein